MRLLSPRHKSAVSSALAAGWTAQRFINYTGPFVVAGSPASLALAGPGVPRAGRLLSRGGCSRPGDRAVWAGSERGANFQPGEGTRTTCLGLEGTVRGEPRPGTQVSVWFSERSSPTPGLGEGGDAGRWSQLRDVPSGSRRVS